MESFDELGLDEALVEALAAEGVERPTIFQQAAIPVIRRGNNLVGRAGSGGGCEIAYSAALLDRLDVDGEPTRALILTPTPQAARRGAELLARLSSATGHTVGALGSPWVLPEQAAVLLGTPRDVLAAVHGSKIKLDALEAVVVDGAAALSGLGETAALEALMEVVPSDAQRVVLALPLTPDLESLVERHVRKAVHLPPRAVASPDGGTVPRRGDVQYTVCAEDRNDALLALVEDLLSADARHVLVFFSSEDRAADGGDFLTLHGYVAGAPGDGSVPVWLGVDELEARKAASASDQPEAVATVSFDVPPDADSVDRRHGAGSTPAILVLPRELPHLRDAAATAGYALLPRPTPLPSTASRDLDELRSRITETIAGGDLLGELLLLQPLLDTHAPAEVAAALLSLLRSDAANVQLPGGSGRSARPTPPDTPSWVRLFISIGTRDGVGPGDIVGAISGESGIKGSQVGKIEIRESISLVEVEQDVAETVIKALNGTSVRGRSVRVDFDRGNRGGRDPGGGRGGGARGSAGGARGPGGSARGGRGGPPRRD